MPALASFGVKQFLGFKHTATPWKENQNQCILLQVLATPKLDRGARAKRIVAGRENDYAGMAERTVLVHPRDLGSREVQIDA